MAYRKIFLYTVILCFIGTTCAVANPISLPDPDTTGGKPLMAALTERQTDRTFATTDLTQQQLSNLLYAAAGQNRTNGKFTYPTARDTRNMRVVVLLSSGAFAYHPKDHSLRRVADTDLRGIVAQQAFVKMAPVTLLYIADTAKTPEVWSAMHAGSMYQNAGLYCASEGLHNVVRGMFPSDKIAEALSLGKNEKVIITQTVGLPPKK